LCIKNWNQFTWMCFYSLKNSYDDQMNLPCTNWTLPVANDTLCDRLSSLPNASASLEVACFTNGSIFMAFSCSLHISSWHSISIVCKRFSLVCFSDSLISRDFVLLCSRCSSAFLSAMVCDRMLLLCLSDSHSACNSDT